jgi:nucleotide-binding universal stress UspA family protein
VFSNVLVGVDRHTGGRDAAALAMQLVAPDGKLTLAYVYPGDSRLRRTSSPDYRAVEERRATELMASTRERMGITAELRATEAASPGRGLADLADAIGADLLVVGSSHHGRLGRILLGDDTRGALDCAPCVVAVAPAGYATRSDPIGTDESESAENRHVCCT